MKKYAIFCLFSLILCVSPFILQNKVYAELVGYTINISSQIANDNSGQYVDTDKFNSATNTFTADYSYFIETGSISFIGSATASEETTTQPSFTYEWKNSAGDLLTNSSNLVLYKNATTTAQSLILIGETKYVFTIKNTADNSSEQKVITVKITDSSNTCDLHMFIPTIPAEVSNASSELKFSAKLPIVNGSVVNWYLKTPNGSAYNLVQANSEEYSFLPSELVNNKNGFGTYKIMAIGYNKNTKTYYYSTDYEITGTEATKNLVTSDYTIAVRVIDNTRANVEAYEYSLTNSSNLNCENIVWYINNIKYATGGTFIYEPSDTDAYKVVAKYKKTDGTITEIATHRQEPNATGTEQLIIYIAVAVAVLSAIFATSIIITNKKRDVVW